MGRKDLAIMATPYAQSLRKDVRKIDAQIYDLGYAPYLWVSGDPQNLDSELEVHHEDGSEQGISVQIPQRSVDGYAVVERDGDGFIFHDCDTVAQVNRKLRELLK